MFKDLRIKLAQKLLEGTNYGTYDGEYYKPMRNYLMAVDTDSHLVIFKELVKKYGAENAIIYHALYDKRNGAVYGINRFFPYTIGEMERDTGLHQKIQDKALNYFKRKGIIEQKNMTTGRYKNARHFRFKKMEW